MRGKERPSAYLMCSAKFISYARPYMEWPAAGHFHWLSSDRPHSVAIESTLPPLLQPHYKLTQTKFISWSSVACTK